MDLLHAFITGEAGTVRIACPLQLRIGRYDLIWTFICGRQIANSDSKGLTNKQTGTPVASMYVMEPPMHPVDPELDEAHVKYEESDV